MSRPSRHRSAGRLLAAVAIVSLAGSAGCAREATRQVRPLPDAASERAAAEAAYASGDWAAAEPHYRALLEVAPEDAGTWFRLGNIYARSEQPERAIEAYRGALARDGELAKAWFNLGIVQLREAAAAFAQVERYGRTPATAAQGARAQAAVTAILDGQAAPASGDADDLPATMPAGSAP